MSNSERDTFEIHSGLDKENEFEKEVKTVSKKYSSNFFLAEDIPALKNSAEPSRRINDYDFNLLEEDAYKEVEDDVFKLEYRISKIEEDISDIENQLQAAQVINDSERIFSLKERLVTLQDEYETTISLYNEKSASAKLTGCISSIFSDSIKNKIKVLRSKISVFSDRIVSKMPQKIVSVIELRKSLDKLRNINKSVDNLIKLNTPYGENLDKYDKISRYIVKANSIHSDISKYLK